MTGVGLAVAAYVFFEYYVAKHNWRYQTFRLVGEVVQINICPLASTKEICPEEVLCTPKGISLFGVHDREFFITRTKGPDFAVESPSKLVKEYFSESFRELEAYADINVLTINAPSGQNYDIDLTHSEHSHGPAQVYRASSIVAASDQGKIPFLKEYTFQVTMFHFIKPIKTQEFGHSSFSMCLSTADINPPPPLALFCQNVHPPGTRNKTL
ncbi:hypothetical protein BgiMline_002199 [Biomphalaria glabrata]|nr:hypothetical protein BgiMline_002070 [Biomphalaria glabrata]